MKNKALFEDIIGQTPADVTKFVDKSMDVADQIVAILKAKGWSQKKLADALGKKESEVSKWLTGTHNFTLRSITKMEAILGEDIIIAPMYFSEYRGMHAPFEAVVTPIPYPSERPVSSTKLGTDPMPLFYISRSAEDSGATTPAHTIPTGKHMMDSNSLGQQASVQFNPVTETGTIEGPPQNLSVCA